MVREPTSKFMAETEQSSAVPQLNQAWRFQGEGGSCWTRKGAREGSYYSRERGGGGWEVVRPLTRRRGHG